MVCVPSIAVFIQVFPFSCLTAWIVSVVSLNAARSLGRRLRARRAVFCIKHKNERKKERGGALCVSNSSGHDEGPLFYIYIRRALFFFDDQHFFLRDSSSTSYTISFLSIKRTNDLIY